MDFPLIAAASTFLIFILTSIAVFFYLSSRETIHTWRRRAEGQSISPEELQATQGLFEQAEAQMRTILEWFARFNTPSNIEEMRATKRMLINAGYRSAKAPILYTGAKLLLATIAVLVVTAIPAKTLGFPTTNALLFYYLLAATCGYYIPSIWLKRSIAARQDTLQRAIPDALDLMVVCVEAGLGLDQAMARVAAEIYQTHSELGDELTVLGLELRAGVQRQEALRNLAQRTNLDDVKNLVALLVQTDRFGTSIGQALRVHADAMRTTRRLRAEELAAKLPVKLLLPLIFFIFPCMFIVTIGPAVIKIVKVLFPAFAGK
jgi:tight adherence protein C